MRQTHIDEFRCCMTVHLSRLVAIMLFTAGIATAVYSQHAGDLDPTFGQSGRTFTLISQPAGYEYNIPLAASMLVQPDGKILACGTFWSDSEWSGTLMIRWLPNGTIDASFGNDGQIVIPGGYPYTSSLGTDCAIQADGKIVLIGVAGFEDFPGCCSPGIPVRRYTSSGQLDTTFGNNGKVFVPKYWEGWSLAIAGDGKIVGAGWDLGTSPDQPPYPYLVPVFRLNTNGLPDTTFGPTGSGVVTVDGGWEGADVLVQPDGKIIVVGRLVYQQTGFLTRFNSDGSLDSSFGSNGVATTPYADSNPFYSPNALQPDGRILVGGARFNPNGTLDISYGAGGVVSFPTGFSAVKALVQADGKTVYTGNVDNITTGRKDFAVVRFNSNGSLDTNFGNGGMASFPVSLGSLNFASEVGFLQPDGKILLAGFPVQPQNGPYNDTLAVVRVNDGTTPASIRVTNTNDSGPGSLRQAMADAAPGGTIDFDPIVFATKQTITLVSGQLVIDKSLTIQGPGANLFSISGNNASRVVQVNSGVLAALSGVTIRDGRSSDVDIRGGGILNSGTLTVNNSAITSNGAVDGGGIMNVGILTVLNSAITSNFGGSDNGYGGGIYNYTGTLALTNSTVSGNFADFGGGIMNVGTLTVTNSTIAVNGAGHGGGIYANLFANESLMNTIVAGNTVDGPSDIYGTVESASHNLIGDAASSGGIQNGVNGNIVGVNPRIGPLQNNGGPTFTHALSATSRAINAGDNCVLTENGCGFTHPALLNDQRGLARVGTVDIGAFEFQGTPAAHEAPFDFDGDGRTDISVFRPQDGNWYALNSGSTPPYSVINWGNSTDLPVPADFDDDGKTDVAVYRPSSGQWFIINSRDSSFTIATWGTAGDKPVPRDFDGDGKADISVYRPSNGTWYVFRSNGTGWDIVQWGAADDIPVPGNYDSDNKTDIAVYRPSTGQWFVLQSTGGGYGVPWGTTGDKPVPEDFDGDGKDDLAVYRPSDGNWYIYRSNGAGYDLINWGISSDTPVPGDYDGDTEADIAQYRSSTGQWFILKSNGGYDVTSWGLNGDKPLPASYIP